MDDFAEKLSKLLEDPEGLEKIKQIASVIASQTEAGAASAPATESEAAAASTAPSASGLDLSFVSKIMPIIDGYQKGSDDPRVKLLYALKPYLKSDRAGRVEETVNILKITKAAQSAGFNLNFFNRK